MSGIYGACQIGTSWESYKEDISRLSRWNRAYGEKPEECYVDSRLFMGCTIERFSKDAGENGGIVKKGKKYAVIDALIYNRAELLEKGQFSETLSDEELVFYFIEKYGIGALKEINGDFCGVIYDTEAGVCTLFRDHMGVRPLFYFVNESALIFSTDIRGIASLQQVDVSVNEKWLWTLMMGGFTTGLENTEFAHIYCVGPATCLSFCIGEKIKQTEKHVYWKLGQKKIRYASEEAYIRRMRELITDAVARRLSAVDGLIGAELSGGLDSGVIDILISRLKREGVFFSWSLSPEILPLAEEDERLVIADICEQEKIECHYATGMFPLGEGSIISEKMKAIGLELDMTEGHVRRYAFPPYINTISIYETAQTIKRKGANVVFTGHGGDEGVSHRCNAYELFYHGEYIPYLKHMWSLTKGQKHRVYKTARRCAKNLLKIRKQLKAPYRGDWDVNMLLSPEFYKQFDSRKLDAVSAVYDPIDYINKGGSRNRLDVVSLLGACAGVRYLMPYLDYRVIDFAVSIPRHMYLKNGKNRYVFREAFKDIMPESMYNLRTKANNSRNSLSKVNLDVPENRADKKERVVVSYSEKKQDLIARLDRQYWDKYLNWEWIESWVKQDEEEKDQDIDAGVFRHLSDCIRIQCVIKGAKSLKVQEETAL